MGTRVVAAGCFHRADAPGQNPVLNGGVADAQFFRSLAGG